METNHVLDGRTVDVKRAVPREKSSAALPTTTTTSTTMTPSSTAPSAVVGGGGGGGKEPLKPTLAAGAAANVASPPPPLTRAVSSSISSIANKSSSSSGPASGALAASSDTSSRSAPQPKGSTARAEKVPEQARKIFVGGLASGVSDADFRAYFEQFGAIADAVSARELLTPFRPLGVTGAAFALLTC